MIADEEVSICHLCLLFIQCQFLQTSFLLQAFWQASQNWEKYKLKLCLLFRGYSACDVLFLFFSLFWCIAFQLKEIPSHWFVTKWFTCDHNWSAPCTVGNSHPDISMTHRIILPSFQGCGCEHGWHMCFISPVLKKTSDEHFKPWLYCNSVFDICSSVYLLLLKQSAANGPFFCLQCFSPILV